MDWEHLLDAFQFQQKAIIDQKIEPERFIKDHAFVLNADELLIHGSNNPDLKFPEQTFLVNAFDQPWSLVAMDLHGSANREPAQFVSPIEQWMHGLHT